MEHLNTLKALHVIGTALLLLSALGMAIWTMRARRQGNGAVYGRLMQRPLVFVWLVMGISLFSLPFTGWWLVHLVGWPLGQTWLLASTALYTVSALAWVWLVVRLKRLRRTPAQSMRLTLALAVFSAVCLLSIAGLMGAKPV